MTIIFDFDGVLLDSNRVKLVAFINLAKKFTSTCNFKLFEKYIQENSHKTRFDKIKFLVNLENDLKEENLLKEFSSQVKLELEKCKSLCRFLNYLTDWKILSAGDKKEIISILEKEGVNYKSHQIIGNCDNKRIILEDLSNGSNCVFLGDSHNDYLASLEAQVKFYFCEYWALQEELDKMNTVNIDRIIHIPNEEKFRFLEINQDGNN